MGFTFSVCLSVCEVLKEQVRQYLFFFFALFLFCFDYTINNHISQCIGNIRQKLKKSKKMQKWCVVYYIYIGTIVPTLTLDYSSLDRVFSLK